MDCCKLHIISEDTQNFSTKSYFGKKRVRSGTIIINFKNKKVLIIQSYGKLWGFPKGHVEENETTIDCAIRETFEETGIVIDPNQLLGKYTIYNGDGIYYTVNGSELNYNIEKMNNNSEITAIAWICISCLNKKIKSREIYVNSHLKTLIPTISNLLIDLN